MKLEILAIMLVSVSVSAFAEDTPRPSQYVIDQQECAKMGFEEGSRDFSNCLLQLRAIHAQERAATAQEQTVARENQQRALRSMCGKNAVGWPCN